MKLKKFSKSLLLSFYRSLVEGYAYHSSALTYSFTMVLGSLFVFMSFLLYYIPFVDFNLLWKKLFEFMPSYAERVIEKILEAYRHKTTGSLISIALAYYFSVSFVKTFDKSLSYVCSRKRKLGEIAYWIAVPFFVVFVAVALTGLFLFLALSKVLLKSFYAYALGTTLYLFAFFTLTLVYRFMLYKSWTSVMLSGAVFSFLFLLFNKAFSFVVLKVLLANPLYAVMGSLLAFFVWLNLSFYIVLVGAKFSELLDEPL